VVQQRPSWWPRFSSTLRSTAVTARIGRVLGIAIALLFVTGLLSHYQYEPWAWLPEPAKPVWGYRLTQGIHVATGIATIPLLLLKLWSVYPNGFRFPPLRSIKHAIERLSVAILVSVALVQVTTGFLNVLNWYPFPWYFLTVHRFLAYVLVGSVLLHVGVKLPTSHTASAPRSQRRTYSLRSHGMRIPSPIATPARFPIRLRRESRDAAC